MRLDRTNNSWLGRWWWTVDRPMVFALFLLVCLGFVMVTAASPPVAKRIGLDPFYFVHRHQIFLGLGALVMLGVSFLPVQWVKRCAMLGFAGSVLLMLIVPFMGSEIKGAHRWINLGPISIQPSEFMKPCFAVVMAWVCAQKYKRAYYPSYKVAIGLYLLVVGLLAMQPDFGMIITVTAMWGIQFFMAGLPFVWVIGLGIMAMGGVFGAYHSFGHVKKRIDMFLDPTSGDNYQVEKSLEAFHSGGVFGRGPGEGEVKLILPDSHTDYVFAVAGEELGILACILIVSLFAFVVLRGFSRVWKETDVFTMLAVVGLIAQFGVQAIINMGVAVSLLPAKGMTLPFVSYGGSSVIAIALGMGMMLAFTRKRFGAKR
jgi:cell division protein FtsW